MKVLFICKFNVGRSQIAESFFNKFTRRHHAISAGIDSYYLKKYGNKISDIPHEPVLDVMSEIGINMTKKKIKMVNKKMVKNSNIIIALMRKDRAKKDLPKYILSSPKFRIWETKDVSGRQNISSMIEAHRRNRNKIQNLVKKLTAQLEK